MFNKKIIFTLICFIITIVDPINVLSQSASGVNYYSKEEIQKIDPALLDIRKVNSADYILLTVDQWAYGSNLEILDNINKYKNAIAGLERRFGNLNAQEGHLKVKGELVTNRDIMTGEQNTINPNKFKRAKAQNDGSFYVEDGTLITGETINGKAAIGANSLVLLEGNLVYSDGKIYNTCSEPAICINVIHIGYETRVAGTSSLVFRDKDSIFMIGVESDGYKWDKSDGTVLLGPKGEIVLVRSAALLNPLKESNSVAFLGSAYSERLKTLQSGTDDPFKFFQQEQIRKELVSRGIDLTRSEISSLARNFLLRGVLPNFDNQGNTLNGRQSATTEDDTKLTLGTNVKSSNTELHFRPLYFDSNKLIASVETNRGPYQIKAYQVIEGVTNPLDWNPKTSTQIEGSAKFSFGKFEGAAVSGDKSYESVTFTTEIVGGKSTTTYLRKENRDFFDTAYKKNNVFGGNVGASYSSTQGTGFSYQNSRGNVNIKIGNGVYVGYATELGDGRLSIDTNIPQKSMRVSYKYPSNSKRPQVSAVSNQKFKDTMGGIILPTSDFKK